MHHGRHRGFTTTTNVGQTEAAVAVEDDTMERDDTISPTSTHLATEEESHNATKLRKLLQLVEIEDTELFRLRLKEGRTIVGTLDEGAAVSSQVTAYLSKSSQGLNLKARLRLFKVIPEQRRKIEDYRNVIEAALELGKVKLADTHEASAYTRGYGVSCAALLFAHYIRAQNFEKAVALWERRNDPAILSDVEQLDTLPARLSSFLAAQAEVDGKVTPAENSVTSSFPDELVDKSSPKQLADAMLSLISQSARLMNLVTSEWLLSIMSEMLKIGALRPGHCFSAIRTLTSLQNRRSTAMAVAVYRNCLYHLPAAHPPRYLLGSLLRELAKIEDIPGVRYIMHQFNALHDSADARAYQLCLTVSARTGDVTSVQQYFDEYCSKFGPPKDHVYFTPLLYVHARLGEVEKTQRQFDRLAREFHMEPNTYWWNILLAAYARRDDLEGAVQKYRDMMDSGIKPNAHTYGTLMGIAAGIGDKESVHAFVDLARENNVQGTNVMIDTLVETYCNNDELEEAEDLAEAATSMNLEGQNTRMWNVLLRTYAFHRDSEAVLRIQERMRDFNVVPDAMTYAALMQSLIYLGKTRDAALILRRLHLSRQVTAGPFHYALLLNAFAKEGNRDMVNTLYEEMLDRFGRVNLSARLSMLHAKVGRNLTNFRAQKGVTDGMDLKMAEDFLTRMLEELAVSDFASNDPQPGTRRNRVIEAFPSTFFEFMVGVYGLNQALEKAIDLFHRYQDLEQKFPFTGAQTAAPPIQLLTTFMIAYSKRGDFDGVGHIWNTALTEAIRLGRQRNLASLLDDTDRSVFEPASPPPQPNTPDILITTSVVTTPKPDLTSDSAFEPLSDPKLRIIPAQRFLLSRPLTQYMHALAAQSRHEDVIDIVQRLQHVGFVLNSANWNSYVQILAQSPQSAHQSLAYEVFEEKFTPTLPQWPILRRMKTIDSFTVTAPTLRNRKVVQSREPDRLFPTYYTLVYLAAAMQGFMERGEAAGPVQLEHLRSRAPQTVSAVSQMPYLRDEIQGVLLRRRRVQGDKSERLREPRGTPDLRNVLGPAALIDRITASGDPEAKDQKGRAREDDSRETSELREVYGGFRRSGRAKLTRTPGIEPLRVRARRIAKEQARRAGAERKIRHAPRRRNVLVNEEIGDPNVAVGQTLIVHEDNEGKGV